MLAKNHRLILFLLILMAAISAGAESPITFDISGLRWHFAWGLDVVPTGLAVTVGYEGLSFISGLDTRFETTLDAGYEGFETYRGIDFTPHQEIDYSTGGNKNLEFNMASARWELGIKQGLLWNPGQDRNLLQIFLFYRGRYDSYLDGRIFWGTDPALEQPILDGHLDWQANFEGTDAYGLFGNSFLLGLDLDTLEQNVQSQTYDGIFAEASFEISPYIEIEDVPGAADFYRFNLRAMLFKTLYSKASARKWNLFSIYLADYFSVDWADAARSMPLYVMQSFGGTDLRLGLAWSVRGFEKFSWDTQFKIVNNLELRFNLPSIFFKNLFPGFLVYLDAGYGTKFWGAPAGTEGAFLCSSGLGVFVNLLGITSARIYFKLPLVGERFDGADWHLYINFDLHF